MRFGLIVDFRRSPAETRSSTAVYADTVEHLAHAETLGFGHALIGEHHFTDDHFVPSPLIAATAISARTTTMRVATNVALLPLYHPVRLAEDVAVLDVLSNGRVDLGVGVGYNAVEFAGYGVAPEDIGKRANENLDIVRRLLDGDTVNGAKITPPPVQQPHPPIWVGGTSRAAVRRAALYGDAYTGPANPDVWRMYLEELAPTGKEPRLNLTGSPWLFVSEDPERTLALVGPGLLHWFNEAARLAASNNVANAGIRSMATIEDLRGVVSILTPDDMVAKIRSMVGDLPVDTFGLRLAAPGLPSRDVDDHLELFASKVIPHFA
ncbi:LLM class flavin-dependent oxidoreductase [Kutzneria sp. 744]|uniref:LLM class flavin-dependent oxidoreductase n=1 Tax=Kutzneria sp. (strain 744) TaxID=345341 RepID=UPI0005B84D9F|nr:LLM class flavin-dependent oxidoreductase [Kutzneria sp. 744]